MASSVPYNNSGDQGFQRDAELSAPLDWAGYDSAHHLQKTTKRVMKGRVARRHAQHRANTRRKHREGRK